MHKFTAGNEASAVVAYIILIIGMFRGSLCRVLGIFFALSRIIGFRIQSNEDQQDKGDENRKKKKLTIRSSKAEFNDIQINFKLLLHLIFQLNYFMNRIDLLPDSNIHI